MRWFKVLSLALSLFFVSLALAVRAAPVIGGPHASAVEIRAARAAGTTPVRRLVFADTREGKAPFELKVDLAPDYIRMTGPAGDDILDFKLRRLITLSTAERAFENSSLFADVAFRAYEFQNRLMLGKVLGAVGISSDKSPMTLPVIQAQLGLTLPGVPPTPIETATDADGAVRLRSEGKEIARVRFTDRRLSADEQRAFGRFIRRGLILHPSVGDAIASDGRLPAEIWFLDYVGFDAKPRTLALTSDATATLDYPLPADFTPRSIVFDAPYEGLNDLFALMQSAVAGRAGGGPRTVESYRKAIEAAHQSKQQLQIAMLYLEATLQHGAAAIPCPGDSICAFVDESNDDAQVQALMKGLSYSDREASQGVPILRGIERKGLTNGYLIDAWIANDLQGRPEAAQLYANAIRGNPYISPIYKDFGDHWNRNYAASSAWLFYDFGRNLPGAGKIELLAPIDRFEAKLVSDYPQFF